MAELAETATEAVAEAAEGVAAEATDFAEAARRIDSARIAFLALGFAAGAAVGSLVGYRVAYKRLETKFEKIAEDEISQMRDHFWAKERAREQKPDLDGLEREARRYAPDDTDADEMVDVPQEARAPVEEESETKNIFEDREPPVDNWDQEHEENSRDPKVPYVIHKDEHGEKEYTETTLTYYVLDDVLADERDTIIEDQDMVVGAANLDKFGHGSQDANIVYVRNDELGVDVEVCRSQQAYAEAVHGFKHSEPEPRRSRPPQDE